MPTIDGDLVVNLTNDWPLSPRGRYAAPVEIDRWVLPPAVAAALFALAAISPPVSREGTFEGLRVELAGPVSSDGFALARVAIERADDGSLRASSSARVDALDAAGAAVASDEAASMANTPWRVARVRPPAGASRFELRVSAARLAARVSLPVAPAESERATGLATSEVDVVASAGALLPEQRGEVLVRAPGAVDVRIESEFEGVTIEPATAVVGACDVASFMVTVSGLGAPVALVARMRDGATRRWNRRLPVSPGGLSLAHVGEDVVARGTLAGRPVWLVGGTGRALTWWSAATLTPDGDDASTRLTPPRDGTVRWARASLDPRFGDERGPFARWDAKTERCATDDASKRWFEAHSRPPRVPDVTLVFDGAARARNTLASRAARARAFALTCLAVAVGLEAALVLGLGLRRDDDIPAEVRRARRERLGPLAAGVAALLLVGFALGLAALVGARS